MPSNGTMTSAERRAYRLGCRRFELGDDEGALSHFEDLLRTRDGYADVHYRMGVLLDRKDDLASAARSLWKALRINPSYTEAILALASVYERQGDFERAREITERARAAAARGGDGRLDATTRGKLANLQANLGDALREAGELREAIEAYRQALDRCPDYHDIRLRLGVALRDAGLPEQALTQMRRVLEAQPDLSEAAIQLGLTLYTLGRTGDAIRAWSTVMERDPSREEARMYLRLVQMRRA
jgi:tetratricopeptide (TPR) repeat protein